MEFVKLKEKGQVTIPVSVRAEIDAQAGDLFSIAVEGHSIILRPQDVAPRQESAKIVKKKGVDIGPWIGSAKGTFASIDEVDEFMRAERQKWD